MKKVFKSGKITYKEKYANIFGENLLKLRKESGISQQMLAGYIDVTQQCVSEWEKGNAEPTLSCIWKIADVFDVPIDVLLGRKDY